MPFNEILGQSNAVAILKKSLSSGKIAHAYLFAGNEGCGKRKTALALVEALFCGGTDGCGNCATCRKVAGLQHPDLQLVEPDGAFIKIDQIRELQRNLSFRPFEAPKKACIIEAADRLHPAAGNALLKTLEEPPGNAILILLTANVGGVLPTIVSRCQQLHFSSLAQESIEKVLLSSGISGDSARMAASLADGSLKKAFDICGETTLDKRQMLLERLSSLSLQDINTLLSSAEELAEDKDSATELLDILTSFLRDLLLISAGSDDIVNRDLRELVNREAARLAPERIMERISHVFAARTALQRNVNPRLTLEVLFMRLAGG